MNDNPGLVVVCPSCGTSLMAVPRVQQVVLASYGLTYHFAPWSCDHECGGLK